MQISSKEVVGRILKEEAPGVVLDAPCGNGWILDNLDKENVQVDGIDLFSGKVEGYRNFMEADLDQGIPRDQGVYDCIVCCEGIEHLANPGLFFESAREHLQPGGLLIVTTPNVWYPESKLQYFSRGFFPGFPCLVGRIERGTHMHIMPWSYPHLYLYLRLFGFTEITLHEEPLSRAKHWWEYGLGWGQLLYCRNKEKKSKSEEERFFWKNAASRGSIFGRHLIVSARRS